MLARLFYGSILTKINACNNLSGVYMLWLDHINWNYFTVDFWTLPNESTGCYIERL